MTNLDCFVVVANSAWYIAKMTSYWPNRTRVHLRSALPPRYLFLHFLRFFFIYYAFRGLRPIRQRKLQQFFFISSGKPFDDRYFDFSKHIFWSVNNLAITFIFKKVVPINTSKAVWTTTMNLTRYRVVPNSSISQKIYFNANKLPLESFNIGGSVVSQSASSNPPPERNVEWLKTAQMSSKNASPSLR